LYLFSLFIYDDLCGRFEMNDELPGVVDNELKVAN